jgi:hypothetical protein
LAHGSWEGVDVIQPDRERAFVGIAAPIAATRPIALGAQHLDTVLELQGQASLCSKNRNAAVVTRTAVKTPSFRGSTPIEAASNGQCPACMTQGTGRPKLEMSFTLANVVPWGRSYDEYVEMFSLTAGDFHRPSLGCSDGQQRLMPLRREQDARWSRSIRIEKPSYDRAICLNALLLPKPRSHRRSFLLSVRRYPRTTSMGIMLRSDGSCV